MKRRKNAVYTGQTKRVSAGTGGDRKVVNAFYKKLHEKLLPEDKIEIIPLDQVNPAHDLQDQAFIMADYCVRKILPEITSLFRWGDEFTPQLRALAPIVDQETAAAAYAAAYATFSTVRAYYDADAAYAANAAHYAVYYAAYSAASATYNADAAYAAEADAAYVAEHAAECVYHALVTCIEAGDEAAYDRIIAFTNEMLESL